MTLSARHYATMAAANNARSDPPDLLLKQAVDPWAALGRAGLAAGQGGAWLLTQLAKIPVWAAILGPPAAGGITAALETILSRPGPSDIERLRKKELLTVLQKHTEAAEARAGQMLGENL